MSRSLRTLLRTWRPAATVGLARRHASTASPAPAIYPTQRDASGQLLSRTSGPEYPPLRDLSIGSWWREQASTHADRPALVVRHEPADQHGRPVNKAHNCIRWTYGEMDEHISQIINGLVQLGVKHGDRVAVLMMNNSAFACLQVAISYLGAILVTLNPSYKPAELKRSLNHVGASALFVVPSLRSSDYVDHLLGLLPSLGSSSADPSLVQDESIPALRRIVVVDNLTSRPQGWESNSYLASKGDGFKKALDRLHGSGIDYRDILSAPAVQVEPPDAFQVINLQMTSGTTGSPKAVALTSHNLVNNGTAIGDNLAFTPEDVLINVPPLFHCFGLTLGNLAAWTHGSCVVYAAEGFDPVRTLRAASEERATALHGVPSMFIAELEVLAAVRAAETGEGEWPEGIRPGERFEFPRLRTGLTSGSTVPIELQNGLIHLLGSKEQTVVYGMTETSPVSFGCALDAPLQKRCETVGRIYPHCHAKICRVDDPEGKPLPIGETGELCTAGYILMKGYFQDEAKTAEVLQLHDDGILWMRTGDMARMDEEGYVSIVGREKDVIIRGGENIFPVVIENCLGDLDGISSSSVIAVPHEKYGEAVGVFIALDHSHKSASKLTPSLIREHVKTHLSGQNAPDWVWFHGSDGVPPEAPKTASGKVQKVELRVWAKDLKERGVGRATT